MLYKDAGQLIVNRVEDLLSRMTLEEKAAQLCGDLPSFKGGEADTGALTERYPHGLGRFTQYSLMGLISPYHIAKLSNQVQRYFVEQTRLGIPVVFQSENLCGYPAAGGTLFPSMMNVAATWQPELARQMAEVIGQESRAVGITSAMSPVIDVSRDPRWGRTYETFGEDSYLISRMGVSYIKGMQADKQTGVACIAKHFLGYSETQGGLNTAVTRINDRELYEVFATPFEAADKEAEVSGMMASYSEIDGLPVGMNPAIARRLLRDTMGYRGMLTSDGAGILKMYSYYHTAGSYPEAGLLAKKAGLDVEIPVGGAFRELPRFVREGKLDEAMLDESVRRVLTIKFEYGLFENPYIDEEAVLEHMTNKKKQQLSTDIAKQSLVLLQNNSVLPLKKSCKLALIGPHADNLRYPVSGYTYPAYLEMLDAGRQGGAVTFNGIADEAKRAPAQNPFAAIFAGIRPQDMEKLSSMPKLLRSMGASTLKEVLSESFTVSYEQGCTILGQDKTGFAAARKAAEESDVVIFAAGGNCGWVNVTGGEGKDRSHLGLPGVQQELLEEVAKSGKPVVIVLFGPGIFSLPWAERNAAAVLQAWMPGPAAAEAVAAALDGSLNPCGKLPVTIPRSVGQVPVTYNHRMGSGYASSGDKAVAAIFSGGYVDEQSTPLYPFGHGLSYTSFALSDCAVPEKTVPTDGSFTVKCRITNTGDRAGSEVVQLYTHFCDAHVVRPVKQLTAFASVELMPGEKKEVTFRIETSQLGYYNEDMDFVVEPGKLEIMIGTSAHDIAFSDSLMLTGERVNVMGKRSFCSETQINKCK